MREVARAEVDGVEREEESHRPLGMTEVVAARVVVRASNRLKWK
jgi:hypothetical protein